MVVGMEEKLVDGKAVGMVLIWVDGLVGGMELSWVDKKADQMEVKKAAWTVGWLVVKWVDE